MDDGLEAWGNVMDIDGMKSDPVDEYTDWSALRAFEAEIQGGDMFMDQSSAAPMANPGPPPSDFHPGGAASLADVSRSVELTPQSLWLPATEPVQQDDPSYCFFDVQDDYYSKQGAEHHRAIQNYLRRRGVQYHFVPSLDEDLRVRIRRYFAASTDPDAQNELFNALTRGAEHGIVHAARFPAKMSVSVFETRGTFIDGNYPAMDDPNDHMPGDDVGRFDDADVNSSIAAMASTFATSNTMLSDDLTGQLVDKEDSPAASTPTRIKPIPKPQRDVTKNARGYWECTWPNCSEDTKEFSRRCEFNKHMDKHERPYRCKVEGCEKLPGFTYSGGLLRHEREVHGKHGGPKNPLHCPHPNCKRHTGKGFSRQENLNEHLRRVHMSEGGGGGVAAGAGTDHETDDAGSEVGIKRKRASTDDGIDIRDEMKRVRRENEELKKQVEEQTRQTVAMVQQIQELRKALNPQLLAARAAAM